MSEVELTCDEREMVQQAQMWLDKFKVVVGGAGSIPQVFRDNILQGADNLMEVFKWEVKHANRLRTETLAEARHQTKRKVS